jgi:ATP-binding cassette subfamily B protein
MAKAREDIPFEARYRRAHPLRTLFHLVREDKWDVFGSLLLVAVKHSPVVITPIVTANVINIITYPSKHSLHDLWINGVILLAFVVQNMPMHTWFSYLVSRSTRNMELRLRTSLIRRLQQLSIAFHDDFQSGKLHTKVLRDVESVQVLIFQILNTVLMATINVSVALVVTVKKEPVVALFFLVAIPISSILVQVFRRRMRQTNMAFRSELENMSAHVSDMIEMIPITRAHGAEEVEINKMESQLIKVRSTGVRLDILNAVFASSGFVSFNVFQLACLMFTSFLAFKGKILAGDVVLYQGFFGMVVNSINMVMNIYPQITKGFDAINSMGEVLECPDIEFNEGKKRVASVRGDIRFESVWFTYNGAAGPAVRDFSLDIRSGECVAFVGESGSGKSTLMNLVIGFRRPTQGKLYLDGADMQGLDMRTYRHFLAVVPQNTILFSGTVRDNITYGATAADNTRLREVIRMANLEECIDSLPEGLDTMIGEHGSKLSGGQRQRLSLARAMARDPRVIILDEATSSLDSVSEFKIQQALERLAAGRTMLIVAHRLSTIRNARRIVVMKKGECVEIGCYEELMAHRGEFFTLQSLQLWVPAEQPV